MFSVVPYPDFMLAFQLAKTMREQGISKVTMAKRLETSRSQPDRLLDPKKTRISLGALAHAARVVRRTLHLEPV